MKITITVHSQYIPPFVCTAYLHNVFMFACITFCRPLARSRSSLTWSLGAVSVPEVCRWLVPEGRLSSSWYYWVTPHRWSVVRSGLCENTCWRTNNILRSLLISVVYTGGQTTYSGHYSYMWYTLVDKQQTQVTTHTLLGDNYHSDVHCWCMLWHNGTSV